MIIKKENCAHFLASALITCFVLTPTIKVPGFLGVRLDDLLAFLIILLFLLTPSLSVNRIKLPLRGLLIIFLSVLLLASITSGSLQGLPANIMDLTKYIWLAKMFIVYVFFFNFVHADIADHNSIQSRRILLINTIIRVALISSIICFAQYVNFMGLNAYYIPLIAPTQATTLLGDYSTPRVVGMIGNPNAQGYILALSFLALIYKELINHSKVNFIKGIVIFVALLMTLSRTSLVITLVGSLILILLYTKNKSFVYIKFCILSLLSFLLFSLFIFIQQNEVLYNLILWRFESLANIMEDRSFITRFHGWGVNIKFFLDNPILGVGPIPRGIELFGTADNEWLYFARSYGVVGLIWLFLFFFSPFFVLRAKSKDEKNVRFFVLTAILMTIIYMIPAGVFTSSSLNGLLIVILAFYDKNHCYITNENPECN